MRRSIQPSAISHQMELDDRADGRARRRSQPRAPIPHQANGRPTGGPWASLQGQDDSELLINPEDLDLEELDNEEAQFLRTDRRVPVRRGPLPKTTAKWLKIAGAAMAAILVSSGLWMWGEDYARHSPRFVVASSDAVEISGVRNASRAQVMDVAGDYIGRNIFSPSLDESRRRLEQIPWVEHASVMRLLPNRIAFTIEERTPVAFAQIGSRVSLIDSNGVVMGMPANRQTHYSFPVIRGITETEALSSRAAAMKIYNQLVGELGSVDGANYVRQLSEVDLSDPEDVKVTANDPGGTMVVYLGKSDFLPRYKLYVTHIAEWRRQFQNLQSVDLKFEGQMVVNPDKPNISPKSPGSPSSPRSEKQAVATARPITQKAVVKPVSRKVEKPKKGSPQRTQRAQR